jgi:hypothetical protein
MDCLTANCPHKGLHADERMNCKVEGCMIKAHLDRLFVRHEQAAHAVQTGVKMTNELRGPSFDHAKDLRVGVNMRAVETAAIVSLLIRKGVITDVEWFTELAEATEAEKATYEKTLSDHFGRPVSLY